MLPHAQLIDEPHIDNSSALRETQAQYQPVCDRAPLAIDSGDAEGRHLRLQQVGGGVMRQKTIVRGYR